MPLFIAALVVIGIGFALFSSPNTNAIMSCVDRKDYGVASSVTATSRSIGHTLSMAVVHSHGGHRRKCNAGTRAGGIDPLRHAHLLHHFYAAERRSDLLLIQEKTGAAAPERTD